MWRCRRKLPLLVSFPFILYVLVIIVWLADESSLLNIYPAKILARHFSILHCYSSLAKVTDLIRYSQAVNLAFTDIYTYLYTCLYMLYIYSYMYISVYTCIPAHFYVLLLLLCSSTFWKQFNLFTLNVL